MIIVGLLLLAAAAIAAVELIVANDDAQISVHMWRWSWTVDAFWLAVVGAAILMAALLGLAMVKSGSGRARRLRRERRELAKENRQLAQRAEVAEATPAEPVSDVAPHGYDAPRQGDPVPDDTTTVAPARNEVVAPREQTYAGEQMEGRNIDR